MKEQYLTKEGFQDLQDRLQSLKSVRRKEIAEAIHSAKEQGDLSENAEYQSAKEEQNRLEQEISDLEQTMKNAQIISEAGNDVVSIGNTVVLDCDGTKKEYRIVGSNEADPLSGRISNESPMGQAILGAKKGDSVKIPTPTGEKDCKINDIQ